MGDLKNPKLICFKGILFFVAGTMASVALIAQNPTWSTALLLAVAIWAFCRLYYFLFYVIEHYVDSSIRYSGLIPMLMTLLRTTHRGS
jgi:hypothetical protein